MPPLPQATRTRLISQGLSETQVDTLMSIDAGDHVPFDGEPQTQGAVPYFDRLAHGRDLKGALNWSVAVMRTNLDY